MPSAKQNQTRSGGAGLSDSITLDFFLVQFHTETRALERTCFSLPDRQGLEQQIVLVIKRTYDVTGKVFASHARRSHRQVNHGGAADAHFQIAADGARD